jgi:hypothetical protein
MATLSLFTVLAIKFAFFSWSRTIRDSTESSITRRVMTQGRACPIRWHRSADCHSAAGFHHLFQSDMHQLFKFGHLRIDYKDAGCLCEVQRDTACFETNEEDFNLRVLHKVIDAALALDGGHATVEHDGAEARATKTPFHELEHAGELTEHYRLESLLRRSEFVELVNQKFNLGGRSPFGHADSINDGRFLDAVLFLDNLGLLEING